MTGGVHEMEQVVLSLVVVDHTTCLRLDRNAPLPFDVKLIEDLFVPSRLNRSGKLEEPVAERALAMIDVGDDAEVPKSIKRNIRDPSLELTNSSSCGCEPQVGSCEWAYASHNVCGVVRNGPPCRLRR